MNARIAEKKIDTYLSFIDFTRKHPRLSKAALSLIRGIPAAWENHSIATRMYMGGRAIDTYDVDLERGAISFAGTEMRIHGSEYIEIAHRVLGKRMGTEGARRAVYEMASRCMTESLEEFDHSSVWPAFCAHLFEKPLDPEALDSSPALSRLYRELEGMLLRLVFPELGWGNPVFDAFPVPSRVTLKDSVEVDWVAQSEDPYWEGLRGEPVCYAFAGMLAGFVSYITGEEYAVREVECKSAGAPECVFRVEKA